MSRHRGTIAAATLVLVLSSVPGVAIAEEVDGVCDLEISINRAPTLVDNVVIEAYTDQQIVPVGRGFPTTGGGVLSSWDSWVRFDFYVNGVPRSGYYWFIEPDGRVNTERVNPFSFGSGLHSGQIDAVGEVGEVRATWMGEGEPCTDSVMLTHLGPVPVFTDIATSRFIPEIVWLTEAGVIEGCTPTRYCPDASITREQTAAFMARALELASRNRGLLR